MPDRVAKVLQHRSGGDPFLLNMKTTKKNTPEIKPLKITLTLKGKAAQRVRDHAKAVGERPASTIATHVLFGLLLTGNDEEAQEFKRDFAARYIGLSPSATSELHRLAELGTADYLKRYRAQKAATGKEAA
ncbi:hypothetical protein [Luteolibacter marinus]|uniref:hypothetical protein n=1 Tax=Luteolibacter marinus TaxID=2776705 RepID=UPI00186704F1|nr:hypothetical protein [Luteolibacter marinus]